MMRRLWNVAVNASMTAAACDDWKSLTTAAEVGEGRRRRPLSCRAVKASAALCSPSISATPVVGAIRSDSSTSKEDSRGGGGRHLSTSTHSNDSQGGGLQHTHGTRTAISRRTTTQRRDGGQTGSRSGGCWCGCCRCADRRCCPLFCVPEGHLLALAPLNGCRGCRSTASTRPPRQATDRGERKKKGEGEGRL